MTSANAPEKVPPAPEPSPLAGLLSYLVPGLGQIYQGRVAKGVLFFVCLYGLFFYGMYLGSWSNVYLRATSGNLFSSLIDRLSFVGQFPIGVAAWPAIWQYKEMPTHWLPERYRDFMKTPPEGPVHTDNWKGKTLNELQSDGDKFWDLGQIYTIIAGVLNILVIYDAYAGPAFPAEKEKESEPSPKREEEGAPA